MAKEESTSDKMDSATVDRVCKHMNEDHLLSLYAMAMRSVYHRKDISPYSGASEISLKNVQLKSISKRNYTLSYVVCQKEKCEMVTDVIPFDGDSIMAQDSDARRFLKCEHERAFRPEFQRYFVKDPMVVIVLVMIASLLHLHWYGTHLSPRFATAITSALYFAAMAHTAEACYVAVLSRTRAKVASLGTTAKWFFLIALTGYPMTNRFLQLLGGYSAKEKK